MNDLLSTRPAMAANPAAIEPISAEALDKTQAAFIAAFERELANCGAAATPQLAMRAAAAACRQLLADRWALTQAQDAVRGAAALTKRVHYLSMEFLMGRALSNALAAMGLTDSLSRCLAASGLQLGDTLEREADAALGNGGLGRLAACFLDSFAEMGLPSFGYGLRYQYGMFAQGIQQGRQVEAPANRTGPSRRSYLLALRHCVGVMALKRLIKSRT